MKILVGNKSDLQENRVITYEMGHDLATKFGITYIETSAKDATNVNLAVRLTNWKIDIKSVTDVSFSYPLTALFNKVTNS